MKISRVAEEGNAPEWAFKEDSPVLSIKEIGDAAMDDFADRMKTIAGSNTEDAIVLEKDVIEKCAASNKTYYYNDMWAARVVSELKEYASVCDLPSQKFVAMNAADVFQRTSSSQITRTASVEAPTLEIGDAFHLDTAGDTSRLFQGNWENIAGEQKIGDRPVLSGGITAVRGGEDYFTHKQDRTAAWENSIENPDALETFVEKGKEDTGARLKREREEKEQKKVQACSDWEQEKLDAMEGRELLPTGKVFPTESMNAQSGLGTQSSQQRVYNTYTEEDLPDRTPGEKLAGIQDDRKKNIQREASEQKWEQLKKAPTRIISDIFADELTKALGNK